LFKIIIDYADVTDYYKGGGSPPYNLFGLKLKECTVSGLRVLSIILFLFLPSLSFGIDVTYLDSFQAISYGTVENLNNNNLQESDSSSTTSLINSYEASIGLFSLNQASGSLNNQSNMALVTFTPGESLIVIQGDSLHETTGNTIQYSGTIERQSLIENSFENSQGLFMVNQSPGNLNSQSNRFIFSMDNALVLGDAELAQQTGGNVINYDADATVVKKDMVADSFSGTTGVGMISQSSGDLNMIQNTVGISFSRETMR
jgi:hypothetical protein